MADVPYLPLIALYTDNRQSVDGATRFQKLVFLVQEETDLAEVYEFRPDRFGPYSHTLRTDLEWLIDQGYVERDIVTNRVGDPKEIYSLTTAGIRRVRSFIDGPGNTTVLDLVERIKREYNDEPLQDLLRYVYRKYDHYVEATDVDLDSLFDPAARTEFETAPSTRTDPSTIGEALQPTPHTLWQMPKRTTNAYFYYFTDDQYTSPSSKYKQLDDALALLGRNRTGLEVVVIDRDRMRADVWDTLYDGFGFGEYPALVVGESELGVRDVDLNTATFEPTGTFATLEPGVIEDSILDDPDAIRGFLNGLFDGARDNSIREQMRSEKVSRGITIAAEKIGQIIVVSQG